MFKIYSPTIVMNVICTYIIPGQTDYVLLLLKLITHTRPLMYIRRYDWLVTSSVQPYCWERFTSFTAIDCSFRYASV